MIEGVKNRLVAVREALGLSQREFCRGIFLSQSYYALIEGEARELNDRIAALICSKYHVSREFLLTGKGEMFDASAPDVRLGQLLEVFEQLDPLFKEFILLQIRQLLAVQNKSKEKGAE